MTKEEMDQFLNGVINNIKKADEELKDDEKLSRKLADMMFFQYEWYQRQIVIAAIARMYDQGFANMVVDEYNWYHGNQLVKLAW